ncbi:MAG: hypothetical protein JWO18_1411 [Microbacteriaceae bacterium]|nr:hypothetical protein [Microbacteriaceae bacterium]
MSDDSTAPAVPPGGRRSALAIVLGVAVAAIVILAALLQLVEGPIGLALVGVVLVLTPTARRLGRRLALNGSIGLGLIPLLWWVRLPLPNGIGRFDIVIAVLYGFIAYRLACGPTQRATILPTFSRIDWVFVGEAALLVWLFRPFEKYSAGTGAVSMLMGAYGNDDVAHFNIFEMIRRNGVIGSGWGTPADGTLFAYVPYPQHFHALVAFAAESWIGPGISSVDREVGAFGVGTAIVISIAVITLVAAIVSLRQLRHSPGLAVIAAVAVPGFLVLGLGAQSFSYGFPGFLLAVIGTVIAIVLASDTRRTRITQLLAVSALAILVAHCWSLFGPLAGLAWLVVVLRRPWRRFHRRLVAGSVEALVVLATVAAVGFAAWLVVDATRAAGSPEQALATPGAVPVSPLTAMCAIAIAVIALAWARLSLARRGVLLRDRPWASAGLFGLVALVALGEGVVLIYLQFRIVRSLGYFQYKFFNGLFLVVAILLVVQVLVTIAPILAAWNSGREPRRSASEIVTTTIGIGLVSLSILTFATIPANPQSSLADFRPQGLIVRNDLAIAAVTPNARVGRILEAAAVMADQPCARPVFVDPGSKKKMAEANQWAMSLSATWTEGASSISSYIYERTELRSTAQIETTIRTILEGAADRCVVLSPASLESLRPEVRSDFSGRLISW